ncbi:MAG TPA: SMI1/KNR4 family protein [Kofleriaceae bacterium]
MARARTPPKPRATAKQRGKPAATKRAATKPRGPSKRARPTPTAARRAAAKPAAAKPAAAKPAAAKPAAARSAAKPAKPAAARSGARKPPPPAAAPRKPPPARLSGGSAVVKVLESRQPIEALRKFLARIPGDVTREQGQIALGSAQLMLLPIAHEHRGGEEVKQLLDLVLARWDAFPDRSGFHAQEFLRNAFAAVGDDRERIARLSALVPADATSELRFNMAGAYAAAGDRPAMLRALEAALAVGASAAQVRRDPDLARHLHDPAVAALLDRAAAPAIPVDIEPHVAPVRAALEALIAALHKLGGHSRLYPPAPLDAVLAAERAGRIQLPNDYRALLTISDGAALWDHELFGTRDLRGDTPLAHRAREFLATSTSYGGIGMDECVPLASWGRPNHWLLYDPRGTVRDGAPGYLVVFTADPWPIADLADAFRKLEDSVRDVLATN